ncbi:MAG: DUF4358 domain-containing protein [Ruminococcus sp.]|nr:DUF4358 domain-containing protein [Ruminococcus sp.]
MKKFLTFALAMLLCLSLLAGCGAKNVDLSEVMTKLNSDYSLSLDKLSSVDELNTYYSISTEDVKQFAAEIDSTNDAPKEIIMIEAVDADAASRVEEALTNRLNSIMATYNSYSPEQVDMVRACKVTKDGKFVSLIVADEASNMLNVYYEYLK